MTVCKRCYVSGKVQGVFYRAATQTRASELSVTGYARNLEDGRVEVLVCGDPVQVGRLEDWLWQGSNGSVVRQVECEDVSANLVPHHFTTN
ncbi:MAG: acylphosphatase [Gammaproteobacteria bacterium]|nr:acylphosphatase [Gammaproteobacteria bacterium]